MNAFFWIDYCFVLHPCVVLLLIFFSGNVRSVCEHCATAAASVYLPNDLHTRYVRQACEVSAVFFFILSGEF